MFIYLRGTLRISSLPCIGLVHSLSAMAGMRQTQSNSWQLSPGVSCWRQGPIVTYCFLVRMCRKLWSRARAGDRTVMVWGEMWEFGLTTRLNGTPASSWVTPTCGFFLPGADSLSHLPSGVKFCCVQCYKGEKTTGSVNRSQHCGGTLCVECSAVEGCDHGTEPSHLDGHSQRLVLLESFLDSVLGTLWKLICVEYKFCGPVWQCQLAVLCQRTPA